MKLYDKSATVFWLRKKSSENITKKKLTSISQLYRISTLLQWAFYFFHLWAVFNSCGLTYTSKNFLLYPMKNFSFEKKYLPDRIKKRSSMMRLQILFSWVKIVVRIYTYMLFNLQVSCLLNFDLASMSFLFFYLSGVFTTYRWLTQTIILYPPKGTAKAVPERVHLTVFPF